MQNIDVHTMARLNLVTTINIFLCGLIILNINNGVSGKYIKELIMVIYRCKTYTYEKRFILLINETVVI